MEVLKVTTALTTRMQQMRPYQRNSRIIKQAVSKETSTVSEPEKSEDNRPWLNQTQLTATLKGDSKKAINVIAKFRMKKDYRTKINKQFNLK